MNAENRLSISSALPRRAVDPIPGTAITEPKASTSGYVPWLIAAFVVVGLLVAAVATLSVLTARPERAAPVELSQPPEEPASDVELINAQR
jgi:hypothetical protein